MASFFGRGGRNIDKLYTLGMDIGTTTTQLIICEVEVENLTSNYLSVEPKILSRKLIYESPIVITPMHDSTHLNEEALIKLFFGFICESKVDLGQIKTGAVIITGESSLKENASQLIHTIADSTGEFIVATAGADLEAILAGYGSGVRELSYKQGSCLANIDIGGGTTNIVKFTSGEVDDTQTLHIGGRLLKINQDFCVTYISPVLKEVFLVEEIDIQIGGAVDYVVLKQVATLMANKLVLAITSKLSSDYEVMYVSKESDSVEAQIYFVSGGVGEYVYEDLDEKHLLEACLQYGDIGPLLGAAVKEVFEENGLKLLPPEHKIRATVCGSGSYSMQLSGNTIYVDEQILPLKNLPLVRVAYEKEAEGFTQAAKRLLSYHEGQSALYITYRGDKSYEDIKTLAQAIVDIAKEDTRHMNHLIVVVDKNIAKALGHTMERLLEQKRQIICIDNIQNTHGNYVDFGKMVGGSLPIVIKSLIF
jgi:ethanolamine utilization protein EutA